MTICPILLSMSSMSRIPPAVQTTASRSHQASRYKVILDSPPEYLAAHGGRTRFFIQRRVTHGVRRRPTDRCPSLSHEARNPPESGFGWLHCPAKAEPRPIGSEIGSHWLMFWSHWVTLLTAPADLMWDTAIASPWTPRIQSCRPIGPAPGNTNISTKKLSFFF